MHPIITPLQLLTTTIQDNDDPVHSCAMVPAKDPSMNCMEMKTEL